MSSLEAIVNPKANSITVLTRVLADTILLMEHKVARLKRRTFSVTVFSHVCPGRAQHVLA